MARSAAALTDPAVGDSETAFLARGPNVDVVEANCSACHSLDYITTQPRHLSDPNAFWSTEVTKNVYGLRISDADSAAIVKYLALAYR